MQVKVSKKAANGADSRGPVVWGVADRDTRLSSVLSALGPVTWAGRGGHVVRLTLQ